MSLRRFWLENWDASSLPNVGAEFNLPEGTFHHVVKVSRLQEGDNFEALAGAPVALELTIVKLEKKTARVRVTGHRKLPVPDLPRVNLAFAISKWETTESVIEKSVELGVTEFWPLFTENSFAKNIKDLSPARLERWQRIVYSATAQSSRGHLMKLHSPSPLDTFLQSLHQDRSAACLFGYEGECRQSIREALQQLLKKQPTSIWALVGSEGGFSPNEVEKIRGFQLEPATMGPQILRAETACLAMLSVIKYEAGLMR